ncbi:MAG: hypothetical protein Q8J68_13985 [Methanolobus sp.]|uniref:hypothetical protein n=1 Tax=Methanolobus sp. TaxID=1874737 RepID=UPI002730F4C8|nr:hypothetical protein [Methanolobus sp.]MDP2218383.1 hypothetical protein [Methanolobus sp.]
MRQRITLPFTYPGHPLKGCGIFVGSILIALLLVSSASAVTNVTISPQQPVVGDMIVITGYSAASSTLAAYTSFSVEVPVKDGLYEYELKNIKVPEGTDTFSVEAENVSNLEVAVKKFGIPYSRSTTSNSSGFASISQSYVLPFTYKVSISGQAAENEEKVDLTLKGISEIKTDKNGYFTSSYKTNTVPAGLFIVEIDGETFEIELLEKKAAKAKSSGKTGTELAIVPASQLVDNQQTDTEPDTGDAEKELAATPDDDIPPVEENLSGLVDAQPQPSILQQIISWLKGLFK